jgi:crotonobetainyl-CoA:carnitine CoA-transferase CaiB-like acyl-CoA transferase
MKVLDLSTDVAGRFAAKLFALDGAEVLRPEWGGSEVISRYLDRGKQAIDPSTLASVLGGADLVFTSWDRGGPTGLALGLAAMPSSCCEVVTSTFGTTGPYACYRGGPMAQWAAGGYLGITGDPAREPLTGPEHLCAYVTGYAAAAAAEAALHRARRSGRGVRIDISVMETMLSLLQSTFSRLAAGWIRRRTGRFAEVYPLTVRPCADGHVSIGVVTDEEFDRLTIALGMPEIASDLRFATREARMANAEALDVELDRYLAFHSADETVATLQASAVAAAKVVDPGEILDNPQLRHRGYGEKDGDLTMPGNPVRPPIDFSRERAAPGKPQSPAKLPLAGLKVLDFTAYWAGPSATRLLADLGAEVTWVERAGSRQDFEPAPDDPHAVQLFLYHQKMNRHKRSVVLDLGSAEGREAALALAGQADVIVENFRPGVAAKLGLGPVELCGGDPGLVYVSLSGYGSDGPWGDWRSFGPNLEAASSMLARTGYPGGEPMRLGHALPDGVGGLAGALAALRGLRRRDETGRGGWFDVSQLEVYAAISGEDIAAASTGQAFPRIGNRSRHQDVIQGVYRCLGDDQWIGLRLASRDDVAAFCRATAIDVAQFDETAIERHAAACDKSELATRLHAAGIEAFPVLLANEFAADPHLAARAFFLRIDCDGRSHVLPGLPFRSEPPIADTSGRAPLIGEHTQAVLSELGALA